MRKSYIALAAITDDLHAWIWKHNPSGTFAEWNPNVRCP